MLTHSMTLALSTYRFEPQFLPLQNGVRKGCRKEANSQVSVKEQPDEEASRLAFQAMGQHLQRPKWEAREGTACLGSWEEPCVAENKACQALGRGASCLAPAGRERGVNIPIMATTYVHSTNLSLGLSPWEAGRTKSI